nr:cupin domain-containing protein [Parafrankia discariae]
MRGACWLSSADEPPRALRSGDVVLLPGGKEHTLADAPATPAVAFRLDGEPRAKRIGHQHVVGAVAGVQSVLLSGAYRLEPRRPHPLLATLPDLVHLPNRRRHGLHTAVDLLGIEVEEQKPGARRPRDRPQPPSHSPGSGAIVDGGTTGRRGRALPRHLHPPVHRAGR